MKLREARKKGLSATEAPTRAEVYTEKMNTATDNFTKDLRAKFTRIAPQLLESYFMALANRMHEALNEDTGINATRSAANSLAEEIDYQHTEGEKGKARDNLGMLRDYEAMMRINARKVSEGVAEAIFVNEAKTINEKKPYTIEAILRNSFGEIFHPNAVRYMLYMLEHRFAEKIQTTQNRLNNEIIPNLETYAPDANETGMFDVKFNGKKKERNLDELCAAEKAGDANPNLLEKLGGYEKIYAKMNEFFPDYFATITDFGNLTAELEAYKFGYEYVKDLSAMFERFYLGMGTELSFVALKNQVSAATWYGGEAFPVTDMRWIAKQYYYDLLHYAQLPTEQEMMDRCFRVSPNLWDARVEKNQYMVVEDESFNMFEVKRDFATRIGEQGFINVITSDYLLRDYMAANEGIFNADPKAIPYIVADHARTERNVALRLCLRMSVEPVPDRELHRELMLLGADSGEPADTLWQMLCRCMQSSDVALVDDDGKPLLRLPSGGKEFLFGRRVLRSKRRFSMKTGQTETVWYIEDELFRRLVLQDLQNARYIAEDENGKPHYLGSELRGHVFQKYLPGQFFTFDGKYYEMLSVTSDGQVLLRRAADHIDGRPAYRQVRRYTLCHVCDGEDMGALRDIGGLKLRRQTADIRVETPAYWQLSRYNDFASGKHLTINGVPDRTYYRKQILRIDFPALEGTEDAAPTVALLMNEVFRTLFAENADYITAVAPAAEQPYITHTLDCTAVDEPPINGLYIIEDSPMDIGLLVAVERNLSRIFSILCDYLDWHLAALEESLHPAPQPEPPTYAIPPEEQAAEKPRKKGLLGWLGRLFRRIGDFFRKLFGKRKKPADPDQPAEPAAEPPAEGEVPPETAAPTEPDAPEEEATPTEPDAPEEEAAPAEEETTDAPTGDAEPSEGEEPPKEDRSLFDAEPEAGGPEEGEPAEPELTFEPEQVIPSGGPDLERKPYHQRYYLLYGYAEQPQDLHLQEALELLRQLGCDGGSLKQARDGQNVAQLIEKNYVPNRQGVHYCDFCGVELTGAESEVLSDGRERCMNCSRTAVKTEAEFRKLYQDAARGMELFYGVRITVPVKIQMVNAKRLHRSLGKTFVPTAKPDGRTLGVAIKRGNDYSILLENGSPRMSSLMTLVHEMTHIWQYLNWDMDAIRRKYGADMELEVYEGMAKWSEIQYAYLMGETAEAKRAEICTRVRQDEYGRGFVKYLTRYPMSHATHLEGATPFEDKETPL